MSNTQIHICKPYDRVLTTPKRIILLYSPRSTGKSTLLGQVVFVYANMYPNHDIMVTRAHYNSMQDSIYNEIISFANSIGQGHFYKARKAPLRIDTIKGNTIYFKGIGGSDYSRSKGFKTEERKLSLIICDETQQLKDEQSLSQAKATFLRSLDDNINSKVIFAGNPEMLKGHWWNVLCKREQSQGNYEVIHATYKDVAKYLSKALLEEIAIEKRDNPLMYRFLYLGEVGDLAGGAYAQFKRERHYISVEEYQEETARTFMTHIIWGGDGAITHDSTGICPLGVFSDGRAYVLPRFYYDPLKTGVVLAPSQLVDMILRYIDDICRQYNVINDGVESRFYIDCASADLITQLAYYADQYHIIQGFTKKNIIQNNSVVNDCFAKDMVKIVDYGGYFDYYNNRWVDTTGDTEPLVQELESVVWKDGNTGKLDPIVPNDYTDALTYGINAFFLNPDNLNLPVKKGSYRDDRR